MSKYPRIGSLRPKKSGHWIIILCDHRDDIMKPALKNCKQGEKKSEIWLKIENFVVMLCVSPLIPIFKL